MSGQITVTNPAPIPVEIKSLADLIGDGGRTTLANATFTGLPDLPYTLKADEALTIGYTAPMADAPTGSQVTNYAVVTIANGSKFQGEATGDFSKANVTEVDKNATIQNHAAIAGDDTGQGNSTNTEIAVSEP